jgi:hypothetical protein
VEAKFFLAPERFKLVPASFRLYHGDISDWFVLGQIGEPSDQALVQEEVQGEAVHAQAA